MLILVSVLSPIFLSSLYLSFLIPLFPPFLSLPSPSFPFFSSSLPLSLSPLTVPHSLLLSAFPLFPTPIIMSTSLLSPFPSLFFSLSPFAALPCSHRWPHTDPGPRCVGHSGVRGVDSTACTSGLPAAAVWPAGRDRQPHILSAAASAQSVLSAGPAAWCPLPGGHQCHQGCQREQGQHHPVHHW